MPGDGLDFDPLSRASASLIARSAICIAARISAAEVDFVAAQEVMRFLVGQLLPGHVVGQVPGGGLSGMLIEFASAQQLAKFLHFRIAGESVDRADFVGTLAVGSFLPCSRQTVSSLTLATFSGATSNALSAAAHCRRRTAAITAATAAANPLILIIVVFPLYDFRVLPAPPPPPPAPKPARPQRRQAASR